MAALNIQKPPAVGISILLYCCWQASDLIGAWRFSALDRFGWLVFLIWCTPFVLYFKRQSENGKETGINAMLLGFGLFFSVLGQLGSLNVLQHIGLALAIAGLMPFRMKSSRMWIFWLCASISWMPLLGWIGSRIFIEYVFSFRFLLSTFASSIFFIPYFVRRVGNNE